LLDAADVRPGKHVLDVATGPGYAAAEAVRRGAACVAIDVAPAMVDLVRHRHPEVDARLGDMESLPLPDGFKLTRCRAPG
jgi:ubiquinone/menaquinone biosynthesis C-methylase UbiE